jgi:kumamolisin
MASAIPTGHQRVEGSERRLGRSSRLVGKADPNETVTITIMVRRRPDGPPLPDHEYWASTSLEQQKHLSVEESAARYGASQADLDAVAEFARSHGMTVNATSAAHRKVVAAGTVAQMNAAFGIDLKMYDSLHPEGERGPRGVWLGKRQVHRSHEGYLHVQESLAGVIMAVFGLDNRKITAKNTLLPPNFWDGQILTAPQVCQLYGWPAGSIADKGQTIGILAASPGGWDPVDITLYYQNLNLSLYQGSYYVTGPGLNPASPPGATTGNLVAPTPVIGTLGSPTAPDTFATNLGQSDGEIEMDICLSSTVAQGAQIAVYLFDGSAQGWMQAAMEAIKPAQGQPQPTVISCSYGFAFTGDDANGLQEFGITAAELGEVAAQIADAPSRGVTICVATGDNGTSSKYQDGLAHTQYPATDPNVLACGGTTIGNISGSNFTECIWNDGGATAGGVSGFFNSGNSNPVYRQPAYQAWAGVPESLNDSSVGRGIPDVAANASPYSGYAIYYQGSPFGPLAGTSAAAPLIAGFIAQLNVKVGKNVGFTINQLLYANNGAMCRKIVAGKKLNGTMPTLPILPADNACDGVVGYPGTQTGWDACTGWGVFDWIKTVNAVVKGKDKEKDNKEKEKEHKDNKETKEQEKGAHIFDKVQIVKAEIDVSPKQGAAAGPSWLDMAQAVDRLEKGMQELRAFIRPEERPAVRPANAGKKPGKKS